VLNPGPVFLCLFLSLNFLAPQPGQQGKGAPPQKQPQDVIEVEDISGFPLKELGAKKVGEAEVSYYEDSTMATVSLPDVYRQGKNLISLRATIHSRGRKLTKPDTVQLIVYFPADFAAIEGSPGLTIRYDDGQASSGRTERNRQAMVSMNVSYAGLLRFVDYESFRRMAEGRRASIELGEFKFGLDEKQLKAFRDLLRAVEQ
jgi:hypothetical protein